MKESTKSNIGSFVFICCIIGSIFWVFSEIRNTHSEIVNDHNRRNQEIYECNEICNGQKVEYCATIKRQPPGPEKMLIAICTDLKQEQMVRLVAKIKD